MLTYLNRSSKIVYVIFDLDGTLVDTFGLVRFAFNCALRGVLGQELKMKRFPNIYGPPKKIFSRMLSSEKVAAAVNSYHECYRKYFRQFSGAYAGIHDMCRALQNAGKVLGVFTGAGLEVTEMTLELSGLSPYFPSFVTGDDVREPKPSPQGLLLTMRKMNASFDQTIYIGDSRSDIKSSKGAGIWSGAVLWGAANRTLLLGEGPDLVFNQPSDVLEALLGD